MRGTVQDQVLTWVEFDSPRSRTYVYADGTQETFPGITKIVVLKTLCHVLSQGARTVIVYPSWRYILEEATQPMGSREEPQ